jgi:hypothetical protein
MDNPAGGSHCAAGFFQLRTNITDTCGLACSCFPVNKNIGRGFVPEGGGKDRRDGIDLRLAVRENLRPVRMPEYFPVTEYPVIGKVFYKQPG